MTERHSVVVIKTSSTVFTSVLASCAKSRLLTGSESFFVDGKFLLQPIPVNGLITSAIKLAVKLTIKLKT